MSTVLIANNDPAEAAILEKQLTPEYQISVISSPSELKQNEYQADIILLDSNLTEHQGIDILMHLVSTSDASVLMVTPPDDPKCAAEAMRIGAVNYLVKIPNYYSFVPNAIKDSLHRLQNMDELKRMVSVQRQRVAELEQQLGITTDSAPSAPVAELPPKKELTPEERKEVLIKEIANLLRRDEINLPSYPDINIKLKELMKEKASIDKIAELLNKDAAVTSKLITVANSAYYRGVSEVTSTEQAISRLGLTQCRNYVEVISNRALYALNCSRFRTWLEPLWTHNMACAHTCYALARRLQLEDADELFTMGLLHDIGKLLLLQIFIELSSREDLPTEISDEEITTVLDEQHAQFGSTLLKRWKFPDIYPIIARYHECLDEAGSITKPLLIVHLANIMVETMGFGDPSKEDIALHDLDSARFLKVEAELLAEVQDEVQAIMENSTLDFASQ